MQFLVRQKDENQKKSGGSSVSIIYNVIHAKPRMLGKQPDRIWGLLPYISIDQLGHKTDLKKTKMLTVQQ